jgi:hypothetical protein
MNTKPTWCLSQPDKNADAGVDRVFANFPLKNSNAVNYECCVH